MAGIVVVSKNSKGKIELTEEELKKIVNDAYLDGKSSVCCNCRPYYVYKDNSLTVPSTTPWWVDHPWKVTCGSSDSAALSTSTSVSSNDE